MPVRHADDHVLVAGTSRIFFAGSMTTMARLEAVHKRLERLKESPDIWVNYLVLNLVTNLLPSPLARRALNTHGVTLVASNLPGEFIPPVCFITPTPHDRQAMREAPRAKGFTGRGGRGGSGLAC